MKKYAPDKIRTCVDRLTAGSPNRLEDRSKGTLPSITSWVKTLDAWTRWYNQLFLH